MPRHLVQTVRQGIVVYSFYRAVTSSLFCVTGLREALFLNMSYIVTCIRDSANFSVLEEMNVRHTKLGGGDIEKAARVNIHETVICHAGSILATSG